jgi:hypothetical protein
VADPASASAYVPENAPAGGVWDAGMTGATGTENGTAGAAAPPGIALNPTGVTDSTTESSARGASSVVAIETFRWLIRSPSCAISALSMFRTVFFGAT